MADYTLYGAEVSYFTGKARAYLKWRGVDFEEVDATQEVYRDVILPGVGWPVIPVLKGPSDQIVQDTADIIAFVEETSGLQPPVLPEVGVQRFVSLLLQLYADEWLVIPAMHYRWNYNEDFAYVEFGAMSAPELSPQEQYERGKKNGQRFKGALPVLGVSEGTVEGIERSYDAFLREFSAHLSEHAYLLGDRASFADFAFYGPLYAHLYRDPASGELMKARAPKVADWVERMQAGASSSGELLADDAIPATLLPILSRMMREQLPALRQTAALFGQWAGEASEGTFLPRALGEIEVDIEDHQGAAAARSFPLWRLQVALDVLDQMQGSARARANDLLMNVGGGVLTDYELPARIRRENYRLVLA